MSDASPVSGSASSDLAVNPDPDRQLAALLRQARVDAFLRTGAPSAWEPQHNDGFNHTQLETDSLARSEDSLREGPADVADPEPGATVGLEDEVQRLLALAGHVYASAVTEETRLSYAHRWGRFTAWCAERGLESLPARPEVLMVYLSDAAASGSSVTTLRGWSAAINRIHVEAGETPPGSDRGMALFWRGLCRTLPPPGKAEQMTALRIAALREVCRTIDDAGPDPVEVRDRAVLGLLLAGVRCPEVARLTWDQVDIDDTSMCIRIPSNGSHASEVVHTVVGRPADRAAACPVVALREWRELHVREGRPLSGRVFWHFDLRTPVGTPMTVHAIYRIRTHRTRTLGTAAEVADLEQAVSLLGHRHPIDLRDKAMLTLGFAGAMRRGELTNLRWSDLRLTDAGLVCRIRRSKTDMEGRRQPEIGIPYGRSSSTCPVTALLDWKARVEAQFGEVDPEGWVFTRAGRRGRAEALGQDRIATSTVSRVVSTRAREAGVEGHWGGRSLRAGFVSTAADLEIPLEAIATQSRHRTLDKLALYIRTNDPFRRNPAARVGL